MTVTASMVSDLRAKTGAGMMDCKRALAETSGDLDKAIDYLRTKGLSASAKKADRIAAEGLVQSYIHAGGKIGVLVEVNSETDFVARNPEFQQFVKDVAMHIAAASPAYVRREEVPADVTEKEKAVLSAQTLEQGKPANMIEKIVTGKIDKFYKDICLMEQPFVKDPDKSIEQIQTELVAKIGEKIMVRRFVRFALGEGIAKKSVDFAAEVAQQVASS